MDISYISKGIFFLFANEKSNSFSLLLYLHESESKVTSIRDVILMADINHVW